MPTKAEALHAAKTELSKLQSEMSVPAVRMAAGVRSLLDAVPLKEARQFLHVECGIPTSDLKVYAAFASAFGERAEVVEFHAVPFTVMKALVATDTVTRD